MVAEQFFKTVLTQLCVNQCYNTVMITGYSIYIYVFNLDKSGHSLTVELLE